jgi:CBS domain-containing protein
MTTAEHYRRTVETIGAECSVNEVADAMQARAVGSLVVMREDKPVGIVTDRDLLVRVIAEEIDPGTTTAADVMSEPLHAASSRDRLERLVELMSVHAVRRIPIVDGDELVGIVSLDDVASELADELHDLALGRRRGLATAQRAAWASEVTRELGERLGELGDQLERAGIEARDRLIEEIDSFIERIGGRRH